MQPRTRKGGLATFVVAGAVVVAGAGGARADYVLEGLPSASVGYTDNARLVPPSMNPVSDEFGVIAGTARAHLRQGNADHSLGLRMSDTFYFHGRGPMALSMELAWLSELRLSAPTQMRLGASLAYGQSSTPTGVDVAGGATAQSGLTSRYVSLGATEELVHQVGKRSRVLQSFRFAGMHYLRSFLDFTTSVVVGANARAEREFGQNLLSVEADVADNITPGVVGASDQLLLAQALAGWRRDLGLAWWVQLKAGALGILDFHGTQVLEPAALAEVTYRRIYWFATLSGAQTATANLFIGAATISDQAALRLALPLARSERFFLVGYGGYTYARLFDDTGTHRAYELRTAGASFTARGERLPIWASLEYTYSRQFGNGNDLSTAIRIDDLERQTVMLTVGGAFVHGAAPPPIFHGVLPGAVPLGESRPEDAGRSPEDLPAPTGNGEPGAGGAGSSQTGSGQSSGQGSGNVKNVPR